MQNQFLLSLWQHPEKIKTFCRGFTRMNADETRIYSATLEVSI